MPHQQVLLMNKPIYLNVLQSPTPVLLCPFLGSRLPLIQRVMIIHRAIRMEAP